jgi:hypothetical protein
VTYGDQWQHYRRVRRAMLIALFAPMPALFLLIVVQDRAPLLGTITFVAVLTWMATYLVLNRRWALWPCPRCGQQFRDIWRPLAGRCQHCGLPQWASDGTNAAA